MKTEDVIRMALEAGEYADKHHEEHGDWLAAERFKFAHLAAAAEREACVNIALAHAAFGYSNIPAEIANSISARGEL